MNKQKKKNIILLSILCVLALITVWVLFGNNNGDTTITEIFSQTTGGSQIETQKLPSRQIFDEGLEQDLRFRELEDLRSYQVDLDAKGRSNPFAPIK